MTETLAKVRAQRDALLAACKAAYNWLGENAPIQLGGEGELGHQLATAISKAGHGGSNHEVPAHRCDKHETIYHATVGDLIDKLQQFPRTDTVEVSSYEDGEGSSHIEVIPWTVWGGTNYVELYGQDPDDITGLDPA